MLGAFFLLIFSRKTISKIVVSAFDRSQIPKLIDHRTGFEAIMTSPFKPAWISFVDLSDNFFSNHRFDNYKDLAKNLVSRFKKQDCLMSVMVHLHKRTLSVMF